LARKLGNLLLEEKTKKHGSVGMKISKKLIFIVAAFGLIAGPASSLEARRKKTEKDPSEPTESRRHRADDDGRGARTAGFLGGATAAGVGVGVTKGAAWGLLGAAGGGLAGYFLVRAIQKGKRNRRNREQKNKEMRTNQK
jgi:hypothetical protein